MLHRRTSPTGVVYYASALLETAGIPHAFSTRRGGVSPAPFDSLNLGNPNGCATQDDQPHIQENYHRLQAAIGCAHSRRCYVHQVHGNEVVSADSDFDVNLKADALITTTKENVLAIRTADCAPILIADPAGQIVAAVHAGWRGVIAGVIPAAISRLCEMSPTIEARSLLAAVGPCIGNEAFEVGPEVLAEFERAFGADAPIRRESDGKGRVDLARACRLQLRRAGLPSEQIDITDRCTYRDADEFFSHRRENGVTGRMAALIAPRIL
jgi:hypothetical protein